ncbi:NUDIX domain-containing protein [Streptomyces sp. RFCAC02]|uniref:NUDIX hydrolase n=1 Tax=Streptomyces sp. RFCAC02 TaxID=2499143 RepID=UPI001F0DE18D|nr:NUDIX domain-containing protein [Streptomyces sp. RFCAC02]
MTGTARPAGALLDTVAWILTVDGRVLCARPRGKDVFYVPGGKREGAETDVETLVREVEEELTVRVDPATAVHFGTYEAPGGPPGGPLVRMSCWTGAYEGTLAPSAEIEELAWFRHADRSRVPPVDRLLFDDLRAAGVLA